MNSSSWKSKDNPPTWLAYGAYDVRQAACRGHACTAMAKRTTPSANLQQRDTAGGRGLFFGVSAWLGQLALGPALVCQISVVFGGGVHLGSLQGAKPKLHTRPHVSKSQSPERSPQQKKKPLRSVTFGSPAGLVGLLATDLCAPPPPPAHNSLSL